MTIRQSSIVYTFLLKLYLSQQYQSSYKMCQEFVGRNWYEWVLVGPGCYINTGNPTWFKEKVKRCLADNFIQHWQTVVDNDVFFANYRMYKTTFCFENYFSLLPFNYSLMCPIQSHKQQFASKEGGLKVLLETKESVINVILERYG